MATHRECPLAPRQSNRPAVGAPTGGSMYAFFEGERQIGNPFATKKEVWEAALIEGLVTDVPDEAGGRHLPAGYHVQRVDERSRPRGQ